MRTALAGLAAAVLTIPALLGSAPVASGSTLPVAYCDIPTGTAAWGFHAGSPIRASHGSYARGHGTFSGGGANGVICQVDRVGGADRQIILSVGPGLVTRQHGAVLGGFAGSLMVVPVRVHSSTDAGCKVGTAGRFTLFNAYNGVHRDSAQFTFGGGCRSHRHTYSGPTVTAIVPA